MSRLGRSQPFKPLIRPAGTKLYNVALTATVTGTANSFKQMLKVLLATVTGTAKITTFKPFEVLINGVDQTTQIDWPSFKKTEVLTSQPDSLTFMIRNVAGKTYRPALNDDVKVYRNGILIFGGVVINTNETIDGLVKFYTVTCKDYTEILDGVLVAKTYSNMTAAAIVADLLSNYAPTFTHVNTVAPYTVTAITFNYITLSQCLQNLAQAIPGYDWYIDYNKDVHFFLPSANSAPFSLDDTSGNFIYSSLAYNADQSQIRNSIIVRGGNMTGSTVTNKQVSDGVQIIYYVGYGLSSFVAQHAVAASPTVFTTLNVGRDGIDNPASFDCLYNSDLGLLRFVSAYPAGDVVLTQGVPTFPILCQVQDPVSTVKYGTKQFLILDKTITTQQQAIDRGNAQLAQYSEPLYSGQFITLNDGLIEGQYLKINCPIRGITGNFKIMQIDSVLRTPSGDNADLVYTVQFASAMDVGMIELLNRLLVADQANQVVVSSNTILDSIFAPFETITVGEVAVAAISGTAYAETITAVESSNATLSLATIFVVGPYTPSGFSDTKRPFITNGSLLG